MKAFMLMLIGSLLLYFAISGKLQTVITSILYALGLRENPLPTGNV